MQSAGFKRFVFSSDKESAKLEKLEVQIPEVVEPSYGMYVWPSAPVLAQYVWHHRSKIKGKHVLELGAGTALPGVVAAKLGANVTLSDACHLSNCQANCWKSCTANNLHDIKVIGITWGQMNADLVHLEPVDIILGSDCFYDSKDFEDILVTVAYLADKNPHVQFWTTYQERSADRSLEHLLEKWKLRCTHIPLRDFHASSSNIGCSDLPGPHCIQMMIITRGQH